MDEKLRAKIKTWIESTGQKSFTLMEINGHLDENMGAVQEELNKMANDHLLKKDSSNSIRYFVAENK